MIYEVIWSVIAENELAALWLDPVIRSLVTTASQALDRRLGLNAPDEGESRPGGYRIAFEAPLAVLFQVDQAGRKVTVVRVWAYET